MLYFDLHFLSSSAILLVVALSKLYFSNIFWNFDFCCILFTGNNFICSKLKSWHLGQLYMVCLDFSWNSRFFHFWMPNVVFNSSLFSGLFLSIHWNDLMIAGNLSVNVLNGMRLVLKRDYIVLNRATLTLPRNCFIDSAEPFFSPLSLENIS